MQKENYNDIDSKMKSMLENAEMTPSPRVWKGIERRLDPVAVPFGRKARIWGLSLAGVAAALGGILFFTPFGNSNRLYIPEDAVALTQKPEATAQPLFEVQELTSETVETGTVPSPAAAFRPTEVKAPELISAAPQSATEASVSVEPVQQETETVSEGRPAVQTNREGIHTSERINPLEGLEEYGEDIVSKNPIRFSASGSLGENIGTGAIMNRPMKAPGYLNAAKPETGIYESGASTYGAPITFGIGLDIPISKVFSIGTGLDYSLLTRSFNGIFTQVDADGLTEIEGDVMHRMHYIGIPLNFNFSIYRNKFINVYAFVGGEMEYCFSNSYTIRGGMSDIVYREAVKGFQFSTKAGAGIEARLNKHIGLFLAPAVHYYFMGNQPKSIRTEKQLMVGASMGVRFNLD